MALNGESRFTNFNVLDKVNATDLVRWRSLDISGIEFVNEPLRVDIKSIAIADFFAYVMLSSKGQLNLKDIVRQDNEKEPSAKTASSAPSTSEQKAASAAPPATATNPPPPAPSKPMPVRIGRVVMQGGTSTSTTNSSSLITGQI